MLQSADLIREKYVIHVSQTQDKGLMPKTLHTLSLDFY